METFTSSLKWYINDELQSKRGEKRMNLVKIEKK